MIPNPAGQTAKLSRIPSLLRLVKVGLCLVFFSAAASFLNERSQAQGGVSVVWLSNGLLIGVILCAPRKQWPALLALGAMVDFGVNLGLQTPAWVSAYFALCNMIEVAVASALMSNVISPNPDLREPRQIRSFLIYGVLVAPFIASVLSVVGLHVWLGTDLLHSLQFWFAADVLGVATITPLYLSFHHRRQFSPRSGLETTALIVLLAAVSIFVFYVAVTPLIWVVLLFLILLGARVGFTGSALGLLIVTFLGGFATATEHGPLSLTLGSLSQKILMFQVFVATTMLALYLTEVARARSSRTTLRLEASENRFRLLAEASRDVIVLAGLDGERKYVSPAATELLGWTGDELLGSEHVEITHPEDTPKLTKLLRDCRAGKETNALSYRCRKKDGSYLWVESNIRLFRDAASKDPAGFVYVLRDISERKLAEDKLQDAFHTAEQLALVDTLTGVANRRLLDETLNREWMRAVRDGTSLSLLLIDVDFFKSYNDLHGHLAGDACLQAIAGAIQDSLRRPPDLLARYGGEEFVVVLPNTPNQGAEVIATSILKIVERCAIRHSGSPYGFVTVSLGCATMTATLDSTPKTLLKAADDAMYRAKSEGRNRMMMAGDELVVN